VRRRGRRGELVVAVAEGARPRAVAVAGGISLARRHGGWGSSPRAMALAGMEPLERS
jgi:hypothetical protein